MCWTVVMDFPEAPNTHAARLGGVVPGCLLARPGQRPAWFPTALQNAHRVVLLVLDGLGWHQLRERTSLAPNLSSMQGGPMTTVAPSTTATALTTLATGADPLEHGVLGYRIDLDGIVMNTLSWYGSAPGERRRDLRIEYPPSTVQPVRPFCGERVPVVTRAEHLGSAFTDAHLSGTALRGWRSPSSIVVEIQEALSEGSPFVYAYYDGIDKIAHERGFGSYYDAELAATDRLVGDVLDVLPSGSTLVVVADHGQVQTGNDVIELPAAVTRFVDRQSGEGRFRWLHARSGRIDDLYESVSSLSSMAWVRRRGDILASGWFGRSGNASFARRLGDVALIPFTATSFHDPDDTGAFPLVCRHGSLTEAEVTVPLLAITV